MAHRAYRGAHQRTRAKLIQQLTDDVNLGRDPWPCPRCKLPMQPWQTLDLGHSTPERKRMNLPGDRLEHAPCNRSAQDSPTVTIVNPQGHAPSRQW